MIQRKTLSLSWILFVSLLILHRIVAFSVHNAAALTNNFQETIHVDHFRRPLQKRSNTALRVERTSILDGFRERARYDDQFTKKLTVELGVGFLAQLFAEVSQRGDSSFNEIDLITADLVQGLIANFFAVYFSAPRYDLYPQICTVDCYEVYPDDTFPVLRSTTTILFPYSLTITITTPSSLLLSSPSSRKTTRSYGIGKKSNVNFWEGLPDNAFQKCKQGTSYSLLQRGGSLVKASPKLFAIGFSSMTVGSLFIDFLGLFRIPWTVQAFSEAFTSSPSNFENVLVNALATGVYVAVSTNFRYQFVAGVMEDRVIDSLFVDLYPNKIGQNLGYFFIRTTNTYVGSSLLVVFLRAIAALQSS